MRTFRYVISLGVCILLSNCTRKTESTSFTLTFPKVANSATASSVTVQSSGETWNSSLNPTALSEVNCYVVFIDSPQLPANTSCSNASGGEVVKAGLMRGIFAAGESATIEVPTANDTRIMIAGLKSSTGACEKIAQGTPPTFGNYSYPFLLATEKKNLTPGDMKVDISLQANFGEDAKLNSCTVTQLQPQAQPALIFGQPNGKTVNNYRFGLGQAGPRGVFQSGGKTFVSDCTNSRVLVYNSPPTSANSVADLVLGQRSLDEVSGGAVVSASTMGCVRDVVYDGNRLFVSDTDHHRVMIWNSFPSVNGQAADVFLGQPNAISFSANNGGISASSLNSPYGLERNGSQLIVADKGNNRVLIFNDVTTLTNNVAADVVAGQSSFTSVSAATSPNGLTGPTDVLVAGGGLWVADSGNNRIIKYSVVPSSNYPTASLAVGQGNLSTGAWSCAADGLSSPTSLHYDGINLYIGDAGNHRVLAFNSLPTSSGSAATLVLGQPDFVTCNAPSTTSGSSFSLGTLGAVGPFNGGIAVGDPAKNRILVWNSAPTGNTQAANWVLGQPGLTESIPSNPLTAGAVRLANPMAALSDGNRAAIVDSGNNRVLIHDFLPTAHGGPASIVLGQADMDSFLANRNSGTNANTLYMPTSALVVDNGAKMLVADTGNNRILVWNSFPNANGMAASIAIGQTAPTTNAIGSAADRLSAPRGMHYDGTSLFVADSGNNRVLYYSSMPTAYGASATKVLGQSSFGLSSPGCGRTLMNQPASVFVYGNKLIVADSGNNRVLIWNDAAAFTNGQGADIVLGQATYTTCSSNRGLSTPDADRLSSPYAVYVDKSGRLFVADSGNNRVLVWKSIPTTNGQAADFEIGHALFTSGLMNATGINELTMAKPMGLHVEGNNLWIADSANHRVVRRPLPAIP